MTDTTTEKQLTAFVASLYNLKKISDSLYSFGQKLAIENRSLKVKIGVLESERDDLKTEIEGNERNEGRED